MALVQAITPNPNVACKPGWCLTYVDDAFDLQSHGKTRNYPTAVAAWNASTSKHLDRNFPADCWVPVWFTLANEPAGHVAILAPDGAVWSSSHPTNKTPVRHASLSDIVKYYGSLGLSYLGWTDDVGGVAVVREGDEMTSKEDLEKLWAGFFDRPPMESEYKEFVGKPLAVILDTAWSAPEFQSRMAGLRDTFHANIALKAQLEEKGKVSNAATSDADKKLQAIKDALDIK